MAKKLNSNLHKAKTEKNDEFYTQLNDICKEVKHYREHFKNKIVYCNCDNPEFSNFYTFFSLQFDILGLKKLITTHYTNEGNAYKLELNGYGEEPVKTALKGNGDFRNDESIEILKECDIVVTNPPFSLFREFVTQLEEHNKKYLIVGSMNAITYKETFKLIKDNKLWLGVSPRGMDFVLPNNDIKNVNACWYTNLEHYKRNSELCLFKKYDEKTAKHYDNYNAIEVSKVNDITIDYDGVMGVPITFLDKYNPEQFEILDCNDIRKEHMKIKNYALIKDKDGSINGKNTYARIVIRNRKPEKAFI
jgi:hypothetical protein